MKAAFVALARIVVISALTTDVFAQKTDIEIGQERCGDDYNKTLAVINPGKIWQVEVRTNAACTAKYFKDWLPMRQCVELTRRYFDHSWAGDAIEWWPGDDRGLEDRSNNGFISPVPGNAIVWDNGKIGHVGVIGPVQIIGSTGHITIYEQNWSADNGTTTSTLTITTKNGQREYSLSDRGSYVPKGWLGVPIGQYHNATISQPIVDAYNRYGVKLGWQFDNGWGPYVAMWGDAGDPNNHVWVAWFMQPDPERDRFDPDGITAIILNEQLSPPRAFVVRGGFLKHYIANDGSRRIGRPAGDEYQPASFSIPNFGTVVAMQEFRQGTARRYLAWNGTYNDDSVRLYNENEAGALVPPVAIGDTSPEGVSGMSAVTIKNLFEQARNRIAKAYKVVSSSIQPSNNNGGLYVHEWKGVVLQDIKFQNSPFYHPYGALVMNSARTEVRLLKEGFWAWYMNSNGFQNIGPLETDEYDIGNGIIRQEGKLGYLNWDPSAKKLTVYRNDGTIIATSTGILKVVFAGGESISVPVDNSAGIGGGTDYTGSSSGAGNPEPQPPEIKVDITSLDFGEVEVGERLLKTVMVGNVGNGILEIFETYTRYPVQFSVSPYRFTVPPGDSQRVEVIFTPTSTLPMAAVLTIGGEDTHIALTGRGIRTVPYQPIVISDTLSDGMIAPPSVLIKAGWVLMGATADDPYQKISAIQANERPQQLVYISKDYGLSIHEVSNGFWRAIAGDIPMTWNNVNNVFLPELNRRAGGKAFFRMPTEAEWEYACRAGSHERWPFGKDPWSLGLYAWYYVNAQGVQSVGQKLPNLWGVYDMLGNRWEMTRSLGDYETRRYTDPVGLDGCMVRGGSWQDDYFIASSVSRRPFGPNDYGSNVSFRLLREIPVAPVVASVLPPESSVLTDNIDNTTTATDSTTTAAEPDSSVESSANSPSDSTTTLPSMDSQTQPTETASPSVVDQPAVVVPPPTVVEPPVVVIQPQPSPLAPVLLSPPDNSTETPTRPDLVWTNSDPGNTYELQVSVTPSFTPPMVFETNGGFEWSALYGFANRVFLWSRSENIQVSSLANNTTFYWRVKPQGGDWSQVFRFTTVALPNHPPQFSIKPDSALRLSVGEPLRSELKATDADNDALVFSFAAAPAFMRIDRVDSMRVRIRGVPALSDTGQYQIIAQVTDSKGAADTAIIPLRVAPPITAVEEEERIAGIATSFFLSKNFPNPFNTETMIQYALPSSGNVRLEAYDFLGRFVATLVNGWQEAGAFSVRWDGRDSYGREMPSGIYIYRFTAGAFVITNKMMLMK